MGKKKAATRTTTPDSKAAKREAVRAALTANKSATSTEVAEQLKGQFDIPLSSEKEKKAFAIYVSQQRKALGIGATGGKAGKVRKQEHPLADFTLLVYGREVAEPFEGDVDRALNYWEKFGKGNTMAIEALRRWRVVSQEMGAEVAGRAIDVMVKSFEELRKG